MDAMKTIATQGADVPQDIPPKPSITDRIKRNFGDESTLITRESGINQEAQINPPPTPTELAAAKRLRRAAYFGIRPGTKASGTPEAFEDDEIPPVFHFEMLTATEKQTFYDQFSEGGKLIRAKLPEAERWLLDRKLTGWDLFITGKGEEIPFAKDGDALHSACWDSIPIALRADLMSMILTANEVDQKEAQGVKS